MISVKRKIDNEEIVQAAKECAGILADKKAEDILILDLRKINSYLDYFIICTANSHIHCGALAKEVQRYFRENGFSSMSNPSLDSGWIALDYCSIVVHIFVKEEREYYELERLWGDADFISF